MPADDGSGEDADAAAGQPDPGEGGGTPPLQSRCGPAAGSAPASEHATAPQLHSLRPSAQGQAGDTDVAMAHDAGGSQRQQQQCHVEVCEVPSDAEEDDADDQSDEDSFAIDDAVDVLQARGGRCGLRCSEVPAALLSVRMMWCAWDHLSPWRACACRGACMQGHRTRYVPSSSLHACKCTSIASLLSSAVFQRAS